MEEEEGGSREVEVHGEAGLQGGGKRRGGAAGMTSSQGPGVGMGKGK